MSLLQAGRPADRKEKAIASLISEDEKLIRMNLNISKAFHKQIKQRALNEDTTVTDLVIRALTEYMNKKLDK
jgi:predicted HicB family RNase H-like nuclease